MYDQVTLGLNVDPFIFKRIKRRYHKRRRIHQQRNARFHSRRCRSYLQRRWNHLRTPGFERVFTLLDSSTRTEFYVKDGDHVENKQLVGKIYGDIRVLLCGERTALNYLQRMSGIATYTSQVAALLEGTGIKLLDTRKPPRTTVFSRNIPFA